MKKPRMRYTDGLWVCWSDSCHGVGATMEDAWNDYCHGHGWTVRRSQR